MCPGRYEIMKMCHICTTESFSTYEDKWKFENFRETDGSGKYNFKWRDPNLERQNEFCFICPFSPSVCAWIQIWVQMWVSFQPKGQGMARWQGRTGGGQKDIGEKLLGCSKEEGGIGRDMWEEKSTTAHFVQKARMTSNTFYMLILKHVTIIGEHNPAKENEDFTNILYRNILWRFYNIVNHYVILQKGEGKY